MIRTRLALLLALVGVACWGATPVFAQTGFITKDLTSATCTSNASAGCVALPVSREGSIGVQVNGTYVGTVTFEGSIDGVTYRPLGLTPLNGGTQTSTTTTTGVWVGSAGGLTLIRARVSAYTSGTVTASLQSAPSGGGAGGGSTTGTIALVDGDNDPLTDDPNNALKVSIVAGAASGTTDTDDASIAAAQATVGLSLALGQVFDGTVWRRMVGDATNGVTVNLGTNNDVTVTSGGIALTTGSAQIGHLEANQSSNVAQINGVTPLMGNGASGTGAQRVTIANDSTGLIAVASIAAGDTDIGNVDLEFAGTAAATNNGTASAQTLRVTMASDSTGQVAVTGAALTSLQLIDDAIFADDAAFTLTSSKTIAVGAVRDDALSTLTAVEGDIVPLRVSSTGALHVTGSAGVTEFAEDSSHSSGAAGNLGLAVRSDTGSALAGDGDYIPLMVNAAGALYVTGGGGGTEYVVNAVAPADPTGSAPVYERDDALSTLTEVEGDWTNGRTNARGAVWVELDTTVAPTVGLAAGTNNIGDVDILTFPDNEPFNIAQLAGSSTGLAGAGAVGAATQRVTLASDDPGITALQLIDNAVSGAGFNITQMNGANVTMGNGASGTGVQRVTLANDSTGILALTTGSAQIGHLEANQSSNVAQINGVTPLMGAGNTGTGSPRVTISTDQAALVGLGIYVEDVAETAAGNLSMAGAVRRDTAASSSTTSGDNSTINTDVVGKLWVTGTYAEDVAHAGGETLTAIGCRRIDTAATSAGSSGDWATVDCDSEGKAWVNAFPTTPAATTYIPTRLSDGTNFLTASLDQVHDAAITTNTGPLEMGYASAAAPTNVSANGDAVASWHLLNGSGVTNLAAGGTLITATSTSLNMNCTGGCSGGTQYAEDLAHTSADLVTMAGTVRQDTKGTGLGVNGDIANLYVNSVGELWTAPSGQIAFDAAAASTNPLLTGCYASQAAPADVSADNDATRTWCLRNGSQVVNLAAGGTLLTATSTSLNANITAGTVTTVSTVTAVSDAQVQGKAATDAAVSGNPVYVGGRASAAVPMDMSADGDATPIWLLRSGAQAVQPTFAGVLGVAGNGASGTGVQRVTLANDSTGILALTTSTAQIGHLEANQSSNVAQINGVTPLMGNGATGTGALRVSIANDSTGIVALTTGAAQIGHLEANQSSNVAQINGVTPLMGNGASGTGALRVSMANDSTGILAGVTTVSTVTNLSQLGTVALPVEDAGETAAGVGIYAMGVRRDTQASSAGTTGDNTMASYDATGNLWIASAVIEDAGETAANPLLGMGTVRRDVAAASAGTTADNATLNTDALGLLWARHLDPCSGVAKSFIPINIATATTTELTAALAGASTNYYICSINLVTAAANNVALVDDNTDGCGSVTAGMAGGLTAATGWNFAANGGLTLGNGDSAVFKTVTSNSVVCLVTSAATQLSGSITVVAAP